MKDDAENADLIGLDQALNYVTKSKATSTPEPASATDNPLPRPNPLPPTQLDVPINANTTMRKYYKPNEDNLSSI